MLPSWSTRQIALQQNEIPQMQMEKFRMEEKSEMCAW